MVRAIMTSQVTPGAANGNKISWHFFIALLHTFVSEFITSNPIISIPIHNWLNQGSYRPIPYVIL